MPIYGGQVAERITKGDKMRHFYSENWAQATEKFVKNAVAHGELRWCVAPNHRYDIPYVTIGHGPNKIVFNSGIHGLEGFFGSAAQNAFLEKIVKNIAPSMRRHFSFVLIHAINGWGMENRMREVIDTKNGGLVDLNRNFGVDFSCPDALPQNPKYELAHELLLSRPDAVKKKNAIKSFYYRHKEDGVWAAISNGQYRHPYGLFYGGSEQMTENKMTLSIYDEIMRDAESLVSIGLHTGLGHFDRKMGRVTGHLMVSHPENHKSTRFMQTVFSKVPVVHDSSAVNGPTLLGDLVDCLESRYGTPDVPVYTADFEVGTGEFPVMSPIYKRMDMGDARYDLLHTGQINPQTRQNLTESWYPSDVRWRDAALQRVMFLYDGIFNIMKVMMKQK